MSKIKNPLSMILALGMTIFCAASVYTMIVPPKPAILYNKSDSAQIGWYKLDPNGLPIRDTMVAAYAPTDARNLADMRDYLPDHIPLLKSVWASAGDEVCSEDGVIRTANRPDIFAQAEDSLGRKLPSWGGCITLNDQQVFLVSTYVENSFDSRYFGPVDLADVLGTAEYLGANLLKPEEHGAVGGLGAGLGAEGKIKAGVHPLGLTPCLHIIFGVHPLEVGVHPFLAETPVVIGFEGVHPLKLFNVFNGRS